MISSAPSGFGWESALYDATWSPTPALNFYTDKVVQDFSYAGYHSGEAPIPEVAGPVFNVVTGYGADPTGGSDSTTAIQNAIDAAALAGGGVVYLPAGTYLVEPPGSNSAALTITGSNIVIRGAGKTQSFLLNASYEMRQKKVIDVTGPTPHWRWNSGTAYPITSDLMSPTRTIPVSDTAPFSVGDWIVIRADVTADWVNEHNEPLWLGYESNLGGPVYSRKIVAIDGANNTLTIDAPTRYAIQTRDNARIYIRNNALAEIGLEDFSIGNVQHPGTEWGESDYSDLAKSAGDTHASYLITFRSARDSWIRNVDTFQAAGNTSTAHLLSNGILLTECRGVTIRNCHFQRPQYGGGGGNGYMYRLQNSNECLVEKSTAEFCRHGIVFSHMASSGNVLFDCLDKTTGKATGSSGSYNTSGRSSDHHMHFSHSNLVDVCTADGSWFSAAYRPYGSTPKHNLTAAHTVYWNTKGISAPSGIVVHSQQARYGYVIGTRGSSTGVNTGGSSTSKTAPVDHVEGTGEGDSIDPFSLYLDQLRNRLQLPEVDAGPDLSLFFPVNAVTLDSQVRFGSSETIPALGEILWTQTGGPSGSVIDNPAAALPTIAFPGPGVYTFECVARNAAFAIDAAESRDSITVAVNDWTLSSETQFPAADAYVHADSPDGNFGSGTTLWMKNVSGESYDREIFLKFDLNAFQGRTIEDARLTLHATVPDTDATAETHFVSDDSWLENTVTWANKPAASSLLETWSPNSSLIQEFELTSLVGQEASGDGMLSVKLRIQSQSTSSTIFRYASREHADETLRPRLEVLFRRPSSLTFADWIGGFPAIDPAERKIDDDPDGDHLKNLAELFHQLLPDTPSLSPVALKKDPVGWFLEFSLNPDLPDGAWLRVEFNPDPASQPWSLHPEIRFDETSQPDGFQVRLPNEIAATDTTALRLVHVLGVDEVLLDVPLRMKAIDLTVNRMTPETVELSWMDNGAESYRVYRGDSDDLSQAALIGTVAEPGFSDANADSGSANFYWVRAVSDVMIEGEAAVPTMLAALPPRPDLLLGKSWLSMKGNDRYAVPQILAVNRKKHRRAGGRLAVQSDQLPESIRVSGPGLNRSLRIRYFQMNSGRKNITAALRRGGHQTSVLSGGDSERIEMVLRQRGRRHGNSAVYVIARSSIDPGAWDRVTFQVILR